MDGTLKIHKENTQHFHPNQHVFCIDLANSYSPEASLCLTPSYVQSCQICILLSAIESVTSVAFLARSCIVCTYMCIQALHFGVCT